jgi:hypothetical protein
MVGSRIISMMTKVHMGQREKAIGSGKGMNSIWWKFEAEINDSKAESSEKTRNSV